MRSKKAAKPTKATTRSHSTRKCNSELKPVLETLGVKSLKKIRIVFEGSSSAPLSSVLEDLLKERRTGPRGK